MTYFDPFAGAGLYEDPNNAEEIQYVEDGQCICPFKDEKYGSPLVALYALYQHITEQKVYGTKKVLLVFAEKDRSNFQHLITHVKNFISEIGKLMYSYNCIETKTNVFIQFSLNKITIDIKFFIAVSRILMTIYSHRTNPWYPSLILLVILIHLWKSEEVCGDPKNYYT